MDICHKVSFSVHYFNGDSCRYGFTVQLYGNHTECNRMIKRSAGLF